ncbi:MAG: response regulator [Myxococcaceae bacterium]
MRRPVLIVDDEPDILDCLAEALELEGYSVHPARNGNVALKVLEQCRPMLILLDLNMPDMDGHEFLKVVRGQPQFEKLPIVVMTAGKSSSPGATAFIQKPCDFSAVLNFVERYGEP